MSVSPSFRGIKTFVLAGWGMTVLLIVALTYLLILGQHISLRLAPLLNAVHQARHEVTLGHLWLEELLAGDQQITMSDVIQHLSNADDYLRFMLDENGAESWVNPVSDDEIRPLVEGLVSQIPILQAYAEQRFLDRKTDQVFQVQADLEFDAVFYRFTEDIDIVKERIQEKIRNRQTVLEMLDFAMMAVVVSALVAVIFLVLRWEKQREHYIAKIEKANHQIGEKNEQLKTLAHFDYLTGLPNRALFRDRLIQAMAQLDRNGDHIVVLFVDLDLFKSVNDTMGHQAGDELLIQVSKRITEQVRQSDTVARLAGDEFAVLLMGQETHHDAVASARMVAAKVVESLRLPFTLGRGTVSISASVGVSIAPEDGKDCETLLSAADRAMYHAKTLGRNSFQFYSEALNLEAIHNQQQQRWIRSALASKELQVKFQSRWQLSSGKMLGVEAIATAPEGDMTINDPIQMMDIAEEAGVMESFSDWFMDAVFTAYGEWKEEGFHPGVLAINISASQLRHPGLCSELERSLSEHGLSPAHLMLQFSESSLTANLKLTRDVLRKLKGLGVNLSVNDVGATFTTMRYLGDLPLDGIKLHRSLIHAIGFDPIQQESLEHFIKLAKLMGLDVYADSVETEEQELFLKSKEAIIVQGLRFGRPVNASHMNYMMASRQRSDGNIIRFNRG